MTETTQTNIIMLAKTSNWRQILVTWLDSYLNPIFQTLSLIYIMLKEIEIWKK